MDLWTIAFGVTGLLVVVLVNAGSALYWGGKLSRAIQLLEKIADDHETRIRKLEQSEY